MIENVKIVSSLRSSDNSIFTVTFSSGEKLDFTADEAFEFGLYEEDKYVDGFQKLCTTVLARRMMSFAASYVLFSMKSTYQVRLKLEEYVVKNELEADWAQFSEDSIEEALRRLTELEYINDELFVRRYVNTALKGKPVSKSHILNELVYKKGVNKNLAENVVEEIYSDESTVSDSENAYRLLIKKTGGRVPRGDSAENKKEIAKLHRFAAGKGFPYDVIEDALSRIREESAEN